MTSSVYTVLQHGLINCHMTTHHVICDVAARDSLPYSARVVEWGYNAGPYTLMLIFTNWLRRFEAGDVSSPHGIVMRRFNHTPLHPVAFIFKLSELSLNISTSISTHSYWTDMPVSAHSLDAVQCYICHRRIIRLIQSRHRAPSSRDRLNPYCLNYDGPATSMACC